MTGYRKIWEQNFGNIPKDEFGRTYEIHHLDGNNNNNDINNLLCVSIKEHYNIHYEKGDFGACVMIAKRMNLPANYISNIQKGVKRPGIGGVKKRTIPWNKGIHGYKLNITDIGRLKKISATKSNSKIKDDDIKRIITDYVNNVEIEDSEIGKIMGNGKIYTYKRAFCKRYVKIYNVTEQNIFRILSKNV
jgi:hypothetical protein